MRGSARSSPATRSPRSPRCATSRRDIEARLGLLVRDGVLLERNGWYEFADAGIQEAIYDHVLDERELVHRRALGYWVSGRDRNTIRRLARIAFHAAGGGEHAIAAACWTALARQALRDGDRTAADELLARSVAVLGLELPRDVADAVASLDPQ